MEWWERVRHPETRSWIQDTQRDETEPPLLWNGSATAARTTAEGWQNTISLWLAQSHLSQASLCSLVKGFTALTCSLESSLLAYSTRRKIHSFPSAVTPWMCFSLKAAAFAVSPKTLKVFKVWSNLQRKNSQRVTIRGTRWPSHTFQNNATGKAVSSQSSGHSLIATQTHRS